MERKTHPLKNILVLDNLLEYIPVKDLHSFRLVCKIWYLSSLEKWRANKILTVHSFGEDSYPHAMESGTLREFYSFASYPYRHMLLDGKRTVLKPLVRAPVTDLCFWRPIGNTLTHLTLKDIVIYFNINYFLDVILFKTPNVTDLILERNTWQDGNIIQAPHWAQEPVRHRLKRLKIIGSLDKRNPQVQMYFPWIHFFRFFPHLRGLEIIHVSNCGYKCYDYFDRLIYALEERERRWPKLPLQFMTLNLTIAQPGSVRKNLERSVTSYTTNVRMFRPLCYLNLPFLNTLKIDLALIVPDDIRKECRQRFPFIQFVN